MAPSDRREFLRLGAALAGAASLPPAVAKALSVAAANASASIMDVEHVVICMQENRSFDHYFGTLAGVRGFGDPRPVRSQPGMSVWRQQSQQHPDGFVLPFRGDPTVANAFGVGGGGQSHQDMLDLTHAGRMDRWGATGELHRRMAYHTRDDLPFYYALASAFTVCDAYHCSTLTQTYPNRLHLWTGCNGAGCVGQEPVMDNHGEDETPSADQATDKDIPKGSLNWMTYAERLESAGINWKVYQEYDNFGDNILSVFQNFRPAAIDGPLYKRGRSWVSEHQSDPALRTLSNGDQLVAAFRADLEHDTLPQVSWIVTAADLSEHPQAAPCQGEHVVSQLIAALADNPKVFAKTVFILNYDEVGGFFDHMPPPMPPLSPEQGASTVSVQGESKLYPQGDAHAGLQPLGLGYRVPAIIVSPWSRGGYVCSQVFDHTSVLKFLERRFGVVEENISPWRRSISGDLTSAFDFKTPNEDTTRLALPATADFAARVAASSALPTLQIPMLQSGAVQEAERRRARTLPYRLAVNAVHEEDGVQVVMNNSGPVGAVFYIYDLAQQAGPWRYTVGAGETLSASPLGRLGEDATYDLDVHGPDGLFRNFAGAMSKDSLSVMVHHASNRAAVQFRIANLARSHKTIRVRQASAYAVAPDMQRQIQIDLAPGETQRPEFRLKLEDPWYDLSLSVVQNPGLRRIYAGRVDFGQQGWTDPGISVMRL